MNMLNGFQSAYNINRTFCAPDGYEIEMDTILSFGKHKGHCLGDVEITERISYLKWLIWEDTNEKFFVNLHPNIVKEIFDSTATDEQIWDGTLRSLVAWTIGRDYQRLYNLISPCTFPPFVPYGIVTEMEPPPLPPAQLEEKQFIELNQLFKEIDNE